MSHAPPRRLRLPGDTTRRGMRTQDDISLRVTHSRTANAAGQKTIDPMATFTRAVKSEAKLRMALAGPAGSGKTYTAMILASVLAQGSPFALIDTEHGSASKYADLFTFDVLELDSFHPDRYVEAIQAAEAAGYPVLVIDSLSHAWSGKEGLLEQVERLTKLKHANNTFRAWADATPIQNRFIDTLTGANLHILATMRSKTEYVVETNERGKATPRKIGMAPIQREGVEYEFDLFGEMDQDNTLVIHKSRCPTLSGAVIARPGPGVAFALQAWLSGEPVSSSQPKVALRVQASVAPVDLPVGSQPDVDGAQHNEPEGASHPHAGHDPEPKPATSAAPTPLPGTPRKSLTERARELGYEGDAWMALVYRLTGKREPHELTGQDKTKLAVYLGHLTKLASRPQIVHEVADEEGSEDRESAAREGKRGA